MTLPPFKFLVASQIGLDAILIMRLVDWILTTRLLPLKGSGFTADVLLGRAATVRLLPTFLALHVFDFSVLCCAVKRCSPGVFQVCHIGECFLLLKSHH